MSKVSVVLDEQEQQDLQMILTDGDETAALRFSERGGLVPGAGGAPQGAAQPPGGRPRIDVELVEKES